MKLLVRERETPALQNWWAQSDSILAASWLMNTELRCASGRRPETVRADSVSAILGTLTLVDLTRGDLLTAGTLTPLRSNDAIHLATALRIGADQFVTYDRELGDAASAAGLYVLSPQ